MSRRIAVKLIVSPEMTERSKSGGLESRLIRFPKSVRTVIDAKRTHMEIGIGNKGGVVSLEIKPAYKSDLILLSSLISSKKITDKEAELVGFVSKNTWDIINERKEESKGKAIWASDDITNITIGTDPEFGIYKDGELFPAHGIEEILAVGKLGHDWVPVELRPDGSTDHKDIIKEMKHLLKNCSKPIAKFDWIAGAGGILDGQIKTFGGHIHIGHPRIVKIENRIQVGRQICQVLNDLIAIPLINIDVHFGAERRQMTHYGIPDSDDSVRTDYPDRFEWRVPSGAWMCSPEAASSVLGTTKACVENIYTMLADCNFRPDEVTKRLSAHGSVFNKLNRNSNKSVVKMLIDSPKEGIGKELTKACIGRFKNMSNYKEYEEEISNFSKLVRTSPKDINFSMKESWL